MQRDSKPTSSVNFVSHTSMSLTGGQAFISSAPTRRQHARESAVATVEQAPYTNDVAGLCSLPHQRKHSSRPQTTTRKEDRAIEVAASALVCTGWGPSRTQRPPPRLPTTELWTLRTSLTPGVCTQDCEIRTETPAGRRRSRGEMTQPKLATLTPASPYSSCASSHRHPPAARSRRVCSRSVLSHRAKSRKACSVLTPAFAEHTGIHDGDSLEATTQQVSTSNSTKVPKSSNTVTRS